MAIYHLSVQAIKRSAGRSSVAAAAYRSGSKLEDERTGLTHSYDKKRGVEHSEIFTPTDIEAPAWAHDQSGLWNAAEAAENRKNSVTSREMDVALPDELDPAHWHELARAYAQEISDRYQVAADLNIHAPNVNSDNRNHHFHLQWSTRQLGPDGFGKKTRILDDMKTGRIEIEWMRQRWEELGNEALKKSGFEPSLDRRSLKDQGVKQLPSVHEGPHARGMADRGEHSERVETNKAIRTANAQIVELGKTIEEVRQKKAELQKKIDPQKAAQEEIKKEVDRYCSQLAKASQSATQRASSAQGLVGKLQAIIKSAIHEIGQLKQHQRKVENLREKAREKLPQARAERKIIPKAERQQLNAARREYKAARAAASAAGPISRIWKKKAVEKAGVKLQQVKKPLKEKYGNAIARYKQWSDDLDRQRAAKTAAYEDKIESLRQQKVEAEKQLKQAKNNHSTAEHELMHERYRQQQSSKVSKYNKSGFGM